MHETIKKSYEFLKKEIYMYYASFCKTQSIEDIVECIYNIGRTSALMRILEVDFKEDLREEKKHLNQLKKYLQYDVLNIIATTK